MGAEQAAILGDRLGMGAHVCSRLNWATVQAPLAPQPSQGHT